ncbi:F-box/kelch-repeat protein [Raphanus sativus]|uniref:F-box/kelch-repeat protein At5g39560-like n=1 Tax=Raphanus sativus TaxID=3726 RepID=A0A6J0KAE0_RAPSA|nr:F-box/kelch-repeat protein At5g39560-like [Raphanus sativus]KAJ4913403.1 F-box/kelch-repeat protein [Raphanus sativus]
MISQEVEQPQKRKKTISEPPSTSFSSLPDEIAENILARVSRWDYPRLSLVSKSFHSLLSSLEIYKTRSQIGVNETCVYVCLQLPNQPCASWFSLWTNPNKKRNKRTKRRGKTKFKPDSSGNSVVPTPFSSSHSPPPPHCISETVGSEIYIIGGPDGETSSSVRMLDCKSHTWRDGPNMTVAREDASTALLNEKIYVMGGCDIDAYSSNWVEVFDIRTQSWTALPGPGPDDMDDELRHAYCTVVNVFEGKIYLATDGKDYTYDPKYGTWKLVSEYTSFVTDSIECWCDEMENVIYCFTDSGYLMWSTSEIEGREWREIKGLDKLREHLKSGNEFELANYGGKLLVMWRPDSDLCMGNKIWYAKICLESRCNGREVWGKVECVDVLTFPVETFESFHCLTASV